MNWRGVTIIIILAVCVAVLALAYNFLAKNQKVDQKMINPPLISQKIEEKTIKTQKTLKISGVTLNIEVADTEAKREQGLSGKDGLAENEGMLFVFPKEGYYGFWMKDMKFSIDIAWLDKDKKIIHIEKNVSPETYPKVFYATQSDILILSLYVLEIPSGFLGKNNVKIGDFVAF
jgi:uncharacterized membrane protein (UPF0127 family)